MKGKNILALTLALFLVFSLTPAVAAASPDAITFWDLRNTDNVSTEKLSVTSMPQSFPVSVSSSSLDTR